MDELSKELKTRVVNGEILYKYRFPNIPATTTFIGDFVVVLKNGFTFYIECKKTEGNSVIGINNEKKKHQVKFNMDLQKSACSKHIYILGFYKFNKKGLKKYKYYSNYYLITDITPFIKRNSISEMALRDNYIFGRSLPDVVNSMIKSVNILV